jgi:two-component system phosphate regulon response regulator PhoB
MLRERLPVPLVTEVSRDGIRTVTRPHYGDGNVVMSSAAEESAVIPVAEALQSLVLVLEGAPAETPVVTALGRDAIDAEVATFTEGEGQLEAPPDRPLIVVWMPSGVSDARLAAIVAWAGRSLGQVRLLGCAPDGSVGDSERALSAGFDDFMAGRYSSRELVARLRALARRLQLGRPRVNERVRFGRLVLDGARHELWVDGRRVPVTAMELAILSALMQASGRTMSRAELLDQVWGEDELEVGVRAVDNLVCRLRRKLGDPGLLVTVRGVGFRLADR